MITQSRLLSQRTRLVCNLFLNALDLFEMHVAVVGGLWFCDVSVAVTSTSCHPCYLCCAVGFTCNVADAKNQHASF